MTAPGTLEIRDAEPPAPGPGEVLLRVRRIGVCGSDVHVYHGTHPLTGYPVVQGHEFAAEVVELGEGADAPPVGTKVTAMPQHTCGRCPQCLRGDFHICDELKVMGFQAPGTGQELFAIGAEKIVPLPEGFTFEQGALVEPAAVAVHAVGRAGAAMDGLAVMVLGAGPIGNLVSQVARGEGAKVLTTDLSAFRLDIARRCGLEHTSDASDESPADAVHRVFGGPADVVFECVGSRATIDAAVANVRNGGRVVVTGVFAEPATVDLCRVQNDELTLRGTLMYLREDYDRAVELIAAGTIATDPLVTRHFDFADFPAAYQHIERAGAETMKVMIDL